MSRARVALSLLLLTMATYARAQVGGAEECEPGRAEQEGYRIAAVRAPLEYKDASGLKSGDAFTRNALDQARRAIVASLGKPATATAADRFRFAASTVTCHSMDPVAKTVMVDIRVDRLVVPQGDTAGELLDETSHGRFANVTDEAIVSTRTDYDRSAGQIVGGMLDARVALADVTKTRFGGWKSLNEPFYSFLLSTSILEVRAPWHLLPGQQFRVWFDKLPFANSVLATKGISQGFEGATQRGPIDFRGQLSYSFSANALEGRTSTDLTSESHNELSLQGNAQQEFTLPGGFTRVGGWFDTTHRFGLPLSYNRGGLLARFYDDIIVGPTSFVVDVAGNGGLGSAMPVYRMFTGGNRLDPFVSDRVDSTSDVTWRGPVIRGYGVSSLVLPVTPTVDDVVPSMRYAGVTATIGLPGFTRRLVELADVDEKPIIDKALATAFDSAVAAMMARRLDDGVSVEEARKASRSEAIQLRRSLNSMIRHARSFSARPLLAFDAGHIASGMTEVTAWSAGGGVRVASMKWGTEVLILHSRAHGADTVPPKNNAVVARLYYNVGPE